MKDNRLHLIACLVIGLSLGFQGSALARQAPPAAVEPEALEALQRMSAYLGTFQTVEVTTQTSLDLVTNDDQRLQLDGGAKYKIRRPNGFVIEVSTALKKRRYIYDGKTFTLDAPDRGFYATVPAPATNIETLDLLYEKFNIALPLEDLFRWTDPANRRREALTSGYAIGPAIIGGVQTEQYAFREGDLDWQIWIEPGPRPLPRKLVIIDRSDSTNPAYIATLNWNVNPTFGPDDFTFRPAAGAKAIRLSANTE
jgi:hypothetical protein